MFEVNERFGIPEEEFDWSYARSGGPGGQNVNKVASKAVLHWDVANTRRCRRGQSSVVCVAAAARDHGGRAVFSRPQRFRDQEKNRADCLEKLRELLVEAAFVPKTRKATKPSRGSKERRLRRKQHRSATKAGRRVSGEQLIRSEPEA